LRYARQQFRTVAAATAEPVQEQQPEQPAVEQRSVTLRKPVGVIFAQNKGGPVFVEELTAGGNADKSGVVQVGQRGFHS
jgi:predicted secreted protein